MTPDQWQQMSVFVIGIGGALWRRKRQNEVFAQNVTENVDDTLVKHVTAIDASLTVTNNLVAIHSDKLKEGNLIAGELQKAITLLRQEMGETRGAVERGEVVVKQFNDYLERAKAGKLREEPIQGSGGMMAIKSKKEGK